MTVRIARESGGGMLLRVICDGCGRTAATDIFTPTELCRALGWDCDLGVTYCLRCATRRNRTAGLARRIAAREHARRLIAAQRHDP